MKEQQPMSTTERLVKALEEQNDPRLKPLIEKARQGYYDEFKSELVAPLIQLVEDLRAIGYQEFAQRIIDGEFDCTSEEADEWFRSKEGQSIAASFIAPKQKRPPAQGFGK